MVSPRKIYSVYSQGVIIDKQVQNLFAKFCSIETSLKDVSRSECLSDFGDEALKSLVKSNP